MTAPPNAGRRVDVVFAEEDAVLELELADQGPDVTETLVAALETDGADEAERLLRDAPDASSVRRRP